MISMISILDFSISDLISSRISFFIASKLFFPMVDVDFTNSLSKLSNLFRVAEGTFGLKVSIEILLRLFVGVS